MKGSIFVYAGIILCQNSIKIQMHDKDGWLCLQPTRHYSFPSDWYCYRSSTEWIMTSITGTDRYRSDQNFCRTENAQWEVIYSRLVNFTGIHVVYVSVCFIKPLKFIIIYWFGSKATACYWNLIATIVGHTWQIESVTSFFKAHALSSDVSFWHSLSKHA